MNSYYIPLPFQKSSDAVSMSDCDAAVVGKAYFPAHMAGKLTPRLVQEACKAKKLQTAPKMATIKNCTFLLWKTISTEQESYHFKRVQFLRCIKDWMNTKNTSHIISLERKKVWFSDLISDHFSTGHTHCPTQSHAHILYFRLSLPCVPRFSEDVADLQKSGHVSATLTNELQRLLLWTVGRRIGSAIIRSRKTKIVCVRVYFWRRFSQFGKLLRRQSPSDRETCWGQWYLNTGRKVRTVAPANRQLGWHALRVRTYKKMWAWLWVGQWAWPCGMWWSTTQYTHSTFLSWDITCNRCQY